MSQWFLILALSLIHHWPPSMTQAVEGNGLLRKSQQNSVPLILKGDGVNSNSRQVIYVPPRAYLLCWKGVCDPRLWADMAKRTPYYNFGLGKRSVSPTLGFSSDEDVTNFADGDVTDAQLKSENDKREAGSAARYNFGIGKKSEPSQRFNFGLGKRGQQQQQRFAFGLGKRAEDYYKHKFAFGLGKRDAEETGEDWENENLEAYGDESEHKRQLYNFGLGKRPNPYNFGLGKRPNPYNFGLGKRGLYDFGLGKRNRMYEFGLGKRSGNRMASYSFGLGKREMGDENEGYLGHDVEEEDEDLDQHEEKRAGPYSFGLGKRSVDSKPTRFQFGLGKREATTMSPLSDGGSQHQPESSQTTAAPTKVSHQ